MVQFSTESLNPHAYIQKRLPGHQFSHLDHFGSC
jgi:hypothetical protein